ncbi:MAG: crossover junction endodeoxyribonuclease RuvC [Enterobacterales bacterium]
MTIILGVDPGFKITGYGIIKYKNSKFYYIDSGCICIKNNDFYFRLKNIYISIYNLMLKFNPDCFVIEKIFVSLKNFDSVLKLGQARGVALIAGLNFDIPIFEYSSLQIKKSVTGFRFAKKLHVQHIVKILLNINTISSIDASDALAIAITHCNYNILR